MRIELQPVDRLLPGCYVVFANGDWHGDIELNLDGTWQGDVTLGNAAPSQPYDSIRDAIAYCYRGLAPDDDIVMVAKFYDGPKEDY